MELILGLSLMFNVLAFCLNLFPSRSYVQGERCYRLRELKIATTYHSDSREDDSIYLDLFRRQLTLMPAAEVINRACALFLELMILRRRLQILEGKLDGSLLSAEAPGSTGD